MRRSERSRTSGSVASRMLSSILAQRRRCPRPSTPDSRGRWRRPVPTAGRDHSDHGGAPGGAGEDNQVEASTARRPPSLRGPQTPIVRSTAKKKVEPGGRWWRLQIEVNPRTPAFGALRRLPVETGSVNSATSDVRIVVDGDPVVNGLPASVRPITSFARDGVRGVTATAEAERRIRGSGLTRQWPSRPAPQQEASEHEATPAEAVDGEQVQRSAT